VKIRIFSTITSEGIALTLNGIFLEVNEQLTKMYGFSTPTEIIGRKVTDFVTADSVEMVQSKIRTKQEGVFHLTVKKIDEEYFITDNPSNDLELAVIEASFSR